MYAGAPVLAVSSGGPLETVVHDRTGFLCANTPEHFGAALMKFVGDSSLSFKMGLEAHQHVKQRFGPEAFAVELDKLVFETKNKAQMFQRLWFIASVVVLLAAYLFSK
jgi:alpha-1,3/alpha-1,6-mannosyltransferase